MGDSILSQAEIDALLNGDSGGDEPVAVTGNENVINNYSRQGLININAAVLCA